MKVFCYGVRAVEQPFFDKFAKQFNYEVKCVPNYLNTKETAEMVKGYEAVILRGNCQANKENLDIYKKLGVKYLLTRTAGYDHIDVAYAKQLGFKLAYVPRYSPNAIAELAVTHCLMMLRHLAYATSRSGKKNFVIDDYEFSKEVRNCTVGVIGLGRIGRVTASMFHGMGAKEVLGYDVFDIKGLGDIAKQVPLDELLAKADIISVHVNYKKGDPPFINKEFFAKAKPGLVMVNASRGQLADQQAVIDAIESGVLNGYAADVLVGEAALFGKDLTDKKIEDPILAKMVDLYPKILITPHLGSYTDEAVSNMVEISYQNLKDYVETGACANEIK